MTYRSFPTLGFDPAPGDLGSADAMAAEVRANASALRETADVLAGTGQQDWQGETATAFHETMGAELTPRVSTAADSFATAATALENWATSLSDFQRLAGDLEHRASAALQTLDSATSDLYAAQDSSDPEADTSGPSARVGAASASLSQIRDEAQILAANYEQEAEYVAACLSDAADAAPDQSVWDCFVDDVRSSANWVQDYILPVLEDLIDILAVIAVVATVIALAMNPAGWMAILTLLGKATFWIGVVGTTVDGLQWAGGREDGTEFVLGVADLAAGALLGNILGNLKVVADNGFGIPSGMVPALAGVGGGSTGGAGSLVGVLGIHWDWTAVFAGGAWLVGKAYEDSEPFVDTIHGMNDSGDAVGRTIERIGSLFRGDGFTTGEQRRDIARRQSTDEECTP